MKPIQPKPTEGKPQMPNPATMETEFDPRNPNRRKMILVPDTEKE